VHQGVDDHELAGLLASRARDLLLALRDSWARERRSAWGLEEAADRAAHDYLAGELARLRPADTVLSEEGRDPRQERLGAERVWIVDPLDGSSDYPYDGSDEWAVHVALVEAGRATAGAVAVPSSPGLFGTATSPVVPPADDGRPVVITSRSWVGAGQRVAEALGGRIVRCGSAGVKAMAVVRGTADVYVHPSGLYEWDACAPAAVATAAGLHVSDLDGRPLEFNKARPVVAGLLVCRPEYTAAVLAALHG
jgi:3'(2'), 5'-bisphosphate nucleotidase